METLTGYTIKSESDEGTYYLSCNWRKNKALWVKKEKLQPRMLFKTAAGAKASLSRLLKESFEYENDEFTVVVFVAGKENVVKKGRLCVRSRQIN